MAISYQKLGRCIRSRRKEKGITQEKMAEQMGYSAGYYSKLERGERKISLDHLSRISDLLDIPLHVRLGKESDSSMADMNRLFLEITDGCDAEEMELLVDFCRPVLDLIRQSREGTDRHDN